MVTHDDNFRLLDASLFVLILEVILLLYYSDRG